MLFSTSADLRAKTDREKQTPLHFAARNDAVEACKILVKCDADIEAKDYRKRTPVYVAAELGSLHCNLTNVRLHNKAALTTQITTIMKCSRT